MILAKKGEQDACYETTPKPGAVEWKQVGVYLFPGLPELMLNKSESLEVSQATANDKPVVEVATVWFTGDRKVAATIPGVTLGGFDLLETGSDVFIWGEKNSESVTYVVDYRTGKITPGYRGKGQDIKLFKYPARGSEMPNVEPRLFCSLVRIALTRRHRVRFSVMAAGAALLLGSSSRLPGQGLPSVATPGGLQLLIRDENSDPTLRLVLPGHSRSDRAIEVIFPEHVTAVRKGSSEAAHL
jgi:hypothetical protein